MNTIQIRPCRKEDVEPLQKAAAADNHGVWFPSHILEKDGEIVGYFSAAVPVVLSWQDSKKMNAADSLKELGFIEGVLSQFPFICIPCDPDSPYMTFLPKNGYVEYTKPVKLFIKAR